jgi:Phage integrase, N-terminal SAM-like domain
MTPLRAKYIRDLVIRGRSKNTQKAYTRCVCDLARYYRRSPELISYEEVTGWLHHLIKERQLAASSINIAVSAVRLLSSQSRPLVDRFFVPAFVRCGQPCQNAVPGAINNGRPSKAAIQFTLLILVTAVFFVFVACRYRGKIYIQGE